MDNPGHDNGSDNDDCAYCDYNHPDCETFVVIILTVKLFKLEELEATRKDLEESLVESQGDNR